MGAGEHHPAPYHLGSRLVAEFAVDIQGWDAVCLLEGVDLEAIPAHRGLSVISMLIDRSLDEKGREQRHRELDALAHRPAKPSGDKSPRRLSRDDVARFLADSG